MGLRREALGGDLEQPTPRPEDADGDWLAEFRVTLQEAGGRGHYLTDVHMSERGGFGEVVTPVVLAELADGRLARRSPAEWRWVAGRDQRSAYRLVTKLPASDEPPRRIWVAVFDYGDQTERHEFVLTDFELPTGEDER